VLRRISLFVFVAILLGAAVSRADPKTSRKTGSIAWKVTPAHVVVWLDGKKLGGAGSLTVTSAKAGKHIVKLVRDKSETEMELTVKAGETVRFEFEFEGATVTGFIDRVGAIKSGGTQITDYKTGKGRDARADDNLQLGIYYLAVNHAEELERFRPVKAVELAFLKDLRGGEIKRVQLGLNRQAQQEYEAEMSARLAGLVGRLRGLQETEVYRPDPRAECRYCDFKTLCPLWPEGRELFPQSVERVETAS